MCVQKIFGAQDPIAYLLYHSPIEVRSLGCLEWVFCSSFHKAKNQCWPGRLLLEALGNNLFLTHSGWQNPCPCFLAGCQPGISLFLGAFTFHLTISRHVPASKQPVCWILFIHQISLTSTLTLARENSLLWKGSGKSPFWLTQIQLINNLNYMCKINLSCIIV